MTGSTIWKYSLRFVKYLITSMCLFRYDALTTVVSESTVPVASAVYTSAQAMTWMLAPIADHAWIGISAWNMRIFTPWSSSGKMIGERARIPRSCWRIQL